VAIASLRNKLARHGLAPSKARGQNFLRSPETAARIVELVGLTPEDAAIEIGPGLGDLTRPIARIARRTVAIEVDRGLVALLEEAGLPPSVELRHEDVLRADLDGIVRELGPPVVLLGNLPYAISGRILAALCVAGSPFRRFGLMLQAEVADRVLAMPGTPTYGTLSVWARLWTEARRVLVLGPEEFVPRPKVNSAFVVFDPVPDRGQVEDVGLLRDVVRCAFQYRRKTLRGALRGRIAGAEQGLESAGIDPRRRGETLSELEFVELANAIHRRDAPA
jgi:16S rRNA (adenine1518-N6/adenine1519-N6)-dimethyltransferase